MYAWLQARGGVVTTSDVKRLIVARAGWGAQHVKVIIFFPRQGLSSVRTFSVQQGGGVSDSSGGM